MAGRSRPRTDKNAIGLPPEGSRRAKTGRGLLDNAERDKNGRIKKPKLPIGWSGGHNGFDNWLTLDEIVEKRRQRWEELHDTLKDKQIVLAAATAILSRTNLRNDIIAKPYRLIECCFTIVDKEGNDCPFFFNEVQRAFIAEYETHGTDRAYYILKGRQQGFTTLITAMQLAFAIVKRNFSGFTIADSVANVSAIFADKAKAVFDRLPDILKPHIRASNAYELSFDKLNSTWRIAVASRDLGRSRTLQMEHFSEIATFQCRLADLQAGIGQAATQNAFIIYETTANGYNDAKDLWDSETCVNLFFEWWRTSEYVEKDIATWLNPQAMDAWLEDRVKWLEDKGLTYEQIAWYARKQIEARRRGIERGKICQEYPCFPEEAFQASSTSVFDPDAINSQLARLTAKKEKAPVGYFAYDKFMIPVRDAKGNVVDATPKIGNIRWVEDETHGYITLHRDVEVLKKDDETTEYTPYVIGGDTSGSGIDYMTAKVLNNITGETVATLWVQNLDDDKYAEQMYCLGMYYNEALIAIEVNYSKVPHRKLAELGYTNVYRREKLGTGIVGERDTEAGFLTTSATKPIIIADLIAIMRETPEVENDVQTLKEMLTFARTPNGGYSAVVGAHDDLVMALAIAHHARSQQAITRSIKQEADKMQVAIEKAFNVGDLYENKEHNENAEYMNWSEF